MSLARLKRLQRLESRQPKGRPWFDPWDAIMRLWPNLEAVTKGRACWRKREPAEMSEEQADALARAIRDADRVAERLAAERRFGAEGIVSKKVDGAYKSGPCRVWIKVRNPASIAVQRERSEIWNR
jgi:hypothetical protein